MAVTVITINGIRKEAVDFSYPYTMDQSGFISHKPGFLPQWQSLWWPLDFYTWMAILFTLIAFPIAVYAILNLSRQLFKKESTTKFSFMDIVMDVISLFFKTGSKCYKFLKYC